MGVGDHSRRGLFSALLRQALTEPNELCLVLAAALVVQAVDVFVPLIVLLCLINFVLKSSLANG